MPNTLPVRKERRPGNVSGLLPFYGTLSPLGRKIFWLLVFKVIFLIFLKTVFFSGDNRPSLNPADIQNKIFSGWAPSTIDKAIT